MSIDHQNLARLDLNLLVIFDALMQEGHVTRAASRLGVGQSTMSHHLKRLRELFDDVLFDRVPSGIAPTPYALEVGEAIRETLRRLQRTVLSDRHFNPATDMRQFRVGITDGLEASLLPAILQAVQQAAPGVTLATRTAGESSAAELDRGELDLIVGFPEHGAPHHIQQILCYEAFVCIYDPSVINVSALTLDAFLALPQVRVLGRVGGTDVVDQALLINKRRRTAAFETLHTLAVPYVIKGTSLVAVLPQSAAVTAAAQLGLAVCPVPLDLAQRSIVMLWHASRDDEAYRWLRELVVRAAAPRSLP
jgi:DNA-binding transcriptional LysR family regulator